MNPKPIPEPYAKRICDILAATCGLHGGSARPELMWALTREGLTEYRFMGDLGGGGKVWDNNGHWYVSCYMESETAARAVAMDAANTQLAELRALYDAGCSDPTAIHFAGATLIAVPAPEISVKRDTSAPGRYEVRIGTARIGGVEQRATGWVAFTAADPTTAISLGKRLRRTAVDDLVLHWYRDRQHQRARW